MVLSGWQRMFSSAFVFLQVVCKPFLLVALSFDLSVVISCPLEKAGTGLNLTERKEASTAEIISLSQSIHTLLVTVS